VLVASVIVWRLLVILPSSGSLIHREKPTERPEPSPAPNLHVEGNRLFDAHDRPVRLIGANRSGTEYQCLTYGVFDGPSNQTSIDAMLQWHINVIRIPLNEDCWLGINMGKSPYGGDVYQDGIKNYVDLLIANGITPILELHATAPGSQQATTRLQPLPDRDYSPIFWKEVAKAYKDNTAVIFDLFNEPFPDNNRDTIAAWNCWRDGTNPQTCPLGTAGLHYEAAGMEELVDVVRETGARNILMLGGIQYAATLDHWLEYVPQDPQQELVAAWHIYNYSWCSASSCWLSQALPVMKAYPVITGEIGENDAKAAFILRAMSFLDHPGEDVPPQNYLAWVWNTDQKPYDLITDYERGTPSNPYGSTYMQHVLWLRP
jgi:endoglucanase